MSFDSSSLYGIQNTSSLVIETIIEYSGSILDLTPPDGYVFYSGSLDFWTGSHQEAPPTPYTGSFTGSYTGSYFGTASLSGSFTGSFYGLVVGSGSFTGSFTGSLTGSISGSDIIGFSTTANQTVREGEIAWDDGNGTLDLGLKGGNINLRVGQQTFARVYNAEGTTLNKGEVVYISGSQGNRVAVKRADFLTEVDSAQTLGFVAETITSGNEGFIITNGVLENLNTTGLIEGALLYLSSSGQYSPTKPVAPQHTVILGYVERLHATVGSIYVKIDNGYELGELHNVLTNGVTNGDLLAYSGSVWTHSKILTGSFKLSGSLDVSGSITASLTGSITGSMTGSMTGLLTGSIDVIGSISMNTASLNNPLLKGYYETMVSKTVATDYTGGIVLLDLKQGNVYKILLDASVLDFNISNNPTSNQVGSFVLILEGDGTTRPFSWGSEITWPNGIPSVVSADNNVDVYTFISFNQGTEYLGFVIAQNQSGLV